MKSELQLTTRFNHGQTEVEDMYFTSPYKIMSPFREGDILEFMQMCASAGLLMDDEYDLRVDVGDNCNVSFISQSYEKVFNTKEGKAKKNTDIKVGKKAMLLFTPYPVIPFADSDYESDNRIRIREDSKFMYCDIFSSGRTGMGESFLMKKYHSKTTVYMEDELVFADHTLLTPDLINYEKKGLWDGYTRNGMMYLYGFGDGDEILSNIRSMAVSRDNFQLGATKCKKGILLRVLGEQSDEIWKLFMEIKRAVLNNITDK